MRLLALVLLATAAAAQTPHIEAGVQVGALDARDTLGEKPAIAGGRATIHLYRFLDAEAEINRFPIAGADSAYPGTQFLFGARAGRRFDFGDLIVSYGQPSGYGTPHQFQGTAGFGLWF